MPPKKKAAPKSKVVLPKLVVDFFEEDSPDAAASHFTTRRPIINDSGDEIQDNEENGTGSEKQKTDMNTTVVLERIPERLVNKGPILIESEPEFVEDKEIPIKKIVLKKVTKGKPKLKKQTLEEDSKVKKRAASVEIDVVTKEVEKVVVGKSRKRPMDKNASEPLKPPTSPVNEPPKRNRRAMSVDSASKISKTLKDTVANEDEVSKKNKKGAIKDQQKLPDKSTKPKKTAKKVLNEEKEKSPTQQNIDELNNLPEKPKSKRGAKKDQDIHEEEEQVVEDKNIKLNKLAGRSRETAPKIGQASVNDEGKALKQNPKSTQANSSPDYKNKTDDSDSVPKTLELKPKRAKKGKQIIMSPEKSEESNGKNDSDNTPPEVKLKGVRKGKQTNIEPKEIEEKDKMSKTRGGRKVKGEDFEEVMPKSPSANNIELIQTGDLPNGVLTSPEYGKKENKPAVVKRKTKAKTGKK